MPKFELNDDTQERIFTIFVAGLVVWGFIEAIKSF